MLKMFCILVGNKKNEQKKKRITSFLAMKNFPDEGNCREQFHKLNFNQFFILGRLTTERTTTTSSNLDNVDGIAR